MSNSGVVGYIAFNSHMEKPNQTKNTQHSTIHVPHTDRKEIVLHIKSAP